ncbi:hypothetical protein E2C01_078995 [Portunus trituberculatus]|uniref:Uncharacterized protein n=1 Tax=Portunus trituberculatus TaxID=210409 RepID=A0A5B7IPF7_PORTR|nr:hypothetical protein [Portunus trituberculatus]
MRSRDWTPAMEAVEMMVMVVAALVAVAAGQSSLENEFGCHCMEYWTCITRCVDEAGKQGSLEFTLT